MNKRIREELTTKGKAETLDAVRRWYDAWSYGPIGMTREEATRLPEWDAMCDALGYDRDARKEEEDGD